MPATKTEQLTADDLYAMPDHGGHNELVKGELKPMAPAGTQHGKYAMRLGAFIWSFVRSNELGEVYAAETGFTVAHDPDTVRAPDVAFVSRARIPDAGEPEGFWSIAPDLVVEVISPFDKASEVQDKVRDYLTAGVGLVWVVDPQIRTVTVYESLEQARVLLEDDVLDGGEVLPGIELALADLFA